MCDPNDTKNGQTAASQQARSIAKRGTTLGAASLGLLFLANSLIMPHQQSRRDALGCDSLCQGSMMSSRSTLNLIGATVMGSFSDTRALDDYGGGRRICLWIGIAAAATTITMGNKATSIRELYWSILPGALEQNMHILKALFSEYHESMPEGSSSGDRAASAGSLGLAVGLAMMVGPAAGSLLLSGYDQARKAAMFVLALAALLIGMLPVVQEKKKKVPQLMDRTTKSFWSFLDAPSARSPATLFLLTSRLLSTLSYHIYFTILNPSLRARFDFGPKDYGSFLSFVGFFYAVSQGFLAKMLLDRFGKTPIGRVRLLMTSLFLVTAFRFFAFYSTDLTMVYVHYAAMVTAYGVTSTIVSADITQIPAAGELGSFYGLLAAVESGAGMAGPLIGGALTFFHPTKAPLIAVVLLNGLNAIMVGFAYERIVLRQLNGSKPKMA